MDDAQPGFLEIDLVAHCGSTSAGQFLFTLSTVDVASGWTLCRGVRNTGEAAVFEELAEIRRRLPFPLLGLDADNGGEFINRMLVHYCEDESISLAEDYVNFLQPVLKLVDKTRDGPRVRRRYDTAQTSYRRLLSLGTLPAATRHDVEHRYETIHPVRLKSALQEAQTQLSILATRSHSAVMQRMALGQVPL